MNENGKDTQVMGDFNYMRKQEGKANLLTGG